MKEAIKIILKKIKLLKLNFLNHKFKKYIIDYKEIDDNLEVKNSNGNTKIIKNTIANKVKLMEIIKSHKMEIQNRANYYDNVKEDYKYIMLLSEILILSIGLIFVLSFFTGSYILFSITLLSFILTLVLYLINAYKILLFRAEVKRLKRILNNENIFEDDNELLEIFKELFVTLKNRISEFIGKITLIFENRKYKSKI